MVDGATHELIMSPHHMTDEDRLGIVLAQVCQRFGYFQTFGAPTEAFHISTVEADILHDVFPCTTDHLCLRIVALMKTPTELFKFLEDIFYDEEEGDIILNFVLEHLLLPMHYLWNDDAPPLMMRLIIWMYEAVVDFSLNYTETRSIPSVDPHAWVSEVVPAVHQALLTMVHQALDAPLDLSSYEADCRILYRVLCENPAIENLNVPGLNHVYNKEVEGPYHNVVLVDTSNVLLRLDMEDSDNVKIEIWTFKHT